MQTNRILTSFIVLFFLSSISLPASGDHVWDHRYTISGEVTTQGGNGVYWMPVSVDCSDENATDPSICSLNSGREDSTGLFGSYSIQLHIHTADQGKLLVLDVNGERVEHIIDVTGLDGVQDEEDRFADLDIVLIQEPGFANTFLATIFAIVIFIGGAVLLFINYRKPKKPIGEKVASHSRKTIKIDCPECNAKVKPTNLINHLKTVHKLDEKTAKEMASNN